MLDHAPAVDILLDAGATACGDLIMMIAQRVKAMTAGQVLHVTGYDRGAAEDIPAWCRMTQNTLVYQTISKDAGQPSHFYIQKGQ